MRSGLVVILGAAALASCAPIVETIPGVGPVSFERVRTGKTAIVERCSAWPERVARPRPESLASGIAVGVGKALIERTFDAALAAFERLEDANNTLTRASRPMRADAPLEFERWGNAACLVFARFSDDGAPSDESALPPGWADRIRGIFDETRPIELLIEIALEPFDRRAVIARPELIAALKIQSRTPFKKPDKIAFSAKAQTLAFNNTAKTVSAAALFEFTFQFANVKEGAVHHDKPSTAPGFLPIELSNQTNSFFAPPKRAPYSLTVFAGEHVASSPELDKVQKDVADVVRGEKDKIVLGILDYLTRDETSGKAAQ